MIESLWVFSYRDNGDITKEVKEWFEEDWEPSNPPLDTHSKENIIVNHQISIEKVENSEDSDMNRSERNYPRSPLVKRISASKFKKQQTFVMPSDKLNLKMTEKFSGISSKSKESSVPNVVKFLAPK